MSFFFNKYLSSVILSISIISSCTGDLNQQATNIPKVKVVDLIKKDVPIYEEFVGQVSGIYDIPIRARVDGFIEHQSFKEGNQVKKNQLLYTIDAQPYLAEVANKKSELAEVQTRLINAQNELNRIKPLAEINAVSKSDLDAAIADFGSAKASLEAAQANLDLSEIQLSYTEIKSPISGIIGKSMAKRGEYVGKYPNPVILNTVSKLDTVLVQFFITESDYLRFARQLAENVGSNEVNDKVARRRKENLQMILADGTYHDQKGSVDFIDREVDPTTGSILIQASFPNPSALIRPGQFAKVKVEIALKKDAKLIPQRCVIEVQGKSNVYVVADDGIVKMQEIDIRSQYGDLLLIEADLDFTDKIVIEGIQYIRSGVKVESEVVNFESKSENPF